MTEIRLVVGTLPDSALSALNRALDELGGGACIDDGLVGVLDVGEGLRMEPVHGPYLEAFVRHAAALVGAHLAGVPPWALPDVAALLRPSPLAAVFLVLDGEGACVVHVPRFSPLVLVAGGSA